MFGSRADEKYTGRDVQVGADNSFSQPEKKQPTATKLGIYSTYSP